LAVLSFGSLVIIQIISAKVHKKRYIKKLEIAKFYMIKENFLMSLDGIIRDESNQTNYRALLSPVLIF